MICGAGEMAVRKARSRKYNAGNLVPMLRLAAELCLQMRAAGFTDNGGAIHSAERILNLLGLCLNYPDLSHINNLRKFGDAEFSVDALAAHHRGERVFIEHVAPVRALTRKVVEAVAAGESPAEIEEIVRSQFHLVLLTAEETRELNKQNRSRIDPERLVKAGITLAPVQASTKIKLPSAPS